MQVPGGRQSQLYEKAWSWYAFAFNSGKDVLQLEHQANGKLVGKGSTTISGSRFTFTWSVDTKEQRYSYELTAIEQQTDPIVTAGGTTLVRIPATTTSLLQLTTGPKNVTKKGVPKPGVEQQALTIHQGFQALIASLEKVMKATGCH
jgi:hypothetical protein